MLPIDAIDILLVEDNHLDAELTVQGLKRERLANNITWVKDGQQALDYVFRRGAYAGRAGAGPQLILLDLKMPRIDGIEVLKAIKADDNAKLIPVVVMTSSREESHVRETYELGVSCFVPKPVDFKSLMSITRQTGFYWLAIERAGQSE